jgi:hypothetical protein
MRTRLETQFIGKPFQIQAEGCYAISFFRPSTSNPVSVNGIALEAGQTLSIKQNVGDEDWTTYEIVFYTGTSDNEMYVSRVMPIR